MLTRGWGALIGLELPALIRDLQSGESAWPAKAAAIAVTLVAVRAAWVFPVWAAAGRRRRGGRPSREAAVVSLGRGARCRPAGRALSIPLTTAVGRRCPAATSCWSLPPASSCSRSWCRA